MSDRGRCTGHCCEWFAMGHPEDLEDKLQQFIERYSNAFAGDTYSKAQLIEFQTIYAMVRYRGFRINPHHAISNNYAEQPGHWWTCVHYVDGNCSIYERRPEMCQKFPGNGHADPCPYKACTYKPEIDVPLHRVERDIWRRHIGTSRKLLKSVEDDMEVLGAEAPTLDT